MNEQEPKTYPTEADRAVAWEADRHVESMPLPGAEQSHYSSESQRQLALVAAERAAVAKAAGAVGLTSGEWNTLRSELGRSPGPSDVGRNA
ncbi:MAG TPA: hypothetical protein VMR34_05875 [Candidatus Saccharimonadales bacterium]|jgi:hypothetical protein|nr:hypothetical protein [Candidatus Saccharimonadales bacterium]